MIGLQSALAVCVLLRDTAIRANTRPMASLLQVLLILGSASAFGGDGMTITTNNNATSDLLVTFTT